MPPAALRPLFIVYASGGSATPFYCICLRRLCDPFLLYKPPAAGVSKRTAQSANFDIHARGQSTSTDRAELRGTRRTGGDVASAEPILFPIATLPDEQGNPAFQKWGKDGPPVRSDEKRRHVFVRDGEPVRIKVMHKSGGAANWYRVQNGVGAIGWQARKPEGFIEVPYVGGADPFDREVLADEIYWPEGEKDVDTLHRIGLLATTFGGTGDGLPNGCAAYFAGRNVVILADNDEGGRRMQNGKPSS